MTTRTITGNIKSLTDSAVATGTVTFEKLVTSTTGSTIHQSGVTTATTDANGDFSIALAVPASGSYRYRMILPNGASFYFSIASGASVNVATLIVAETIEDSDAIVEALAAYLPLAGGTLTGQLNFSGTTHAGIKLLSLTTAQRDALTPANGMVIYNSTTATGQVYQGGSWASVGGGGAVDSVFGRTGAVAAASGDYGTDEISDDSVYAKASLTAALDSIANDIGGLDTSLNTHIGETTDVHGIADTSILLDTSDLGVTVQGYDADLAAIAALTASNDDVIQRKTGAWTNRTMAQLKTDLASNIEYIVIACSDETTALAVGTGKATFRMPYAMTLTSVRASVTTAPTGSTLTADINDGGTTILSTKLTIDASEKTSTTAATPAVISDTALADDAEITIDIDAVGSVVAGAGLKVTLIGTR